MTEGTDADDGNTMSALDHLLSVQGEEPGSTADAIQRYERGHLVFVFHEMDDRPTLATGIEIIQNTTSDRMLVLPPDEKLARLALATRLRTPDGYTFERQTDGTWTDGDMTFESIAHLYFECESELIAVDTQKEGHRG